jgi:hypothetical protein
MAKTQGTKSKKEEVVEKPRISKKLKLTALGLVTLIVIVGIGFLFHGYVSAKNDIKRLSNPSEASKQESKDLVDRAGRLVELPKNEEPTIATVKDVSKLQSQPFFKNAQNGDKVLIYTQSKRAVLYRASTDKVIESAPVKLGEQAPGTPAPAQ